VFPPRENEWDAHGKYVQATFWELRLDQVIEVRYFKGRAQQRITGENRVCPFV
jgi:hypothetical protein